MVWISGQSVYADDAAVAVELEVALDPIVTCLAQGLQLTQPERVPVATMRDHVVGDARWCGYVVGKAERAERLDPKLVFGALPMTGELIPVA